jgi:hypothetical protein
MLLDPDSPFLEVGPLAALDVYKEKDGSDSAADHFMAMVSNSAADRANLLHRATPAQRPAAPQHNGAAADATPWVGRA